MDFFQIALKERTEKQGGGYVAYPDFIVGRSKDLMVRAKNFYAIYNPDTHMWSTDDYDVAQFVDDKLHSYQKDHPEVKAIKTMRSFGTNGQTTFRKYMSQIGDNSHQLDENLTFLSTKVKKTDYVSKRLPYDLTAGDISAWDEIVGTLYAPGERAKIEWFIGSIVKGDSKTNQKFMVLEGPPGAGKGTIINIVLKLFPGYITTFDAKALGTNGNQFAAAAFEANPLVAIQHDGDLSKIEDNTVINQIVSHEIMKINQKFKPAYDARILAALMMGTNKPVKISDSQSGIIRRLLDVRPTGNVIPRTHYDFLMSRIDFELGAIANHCLETYNAMGQKYYSDYRPTEMMYKTDNFFNFIDYYYDEFKDAGGVTGKAAFNKYKEYCEMANVTTRTLPFHEFRAELGNYFEEFHDRITLNGVNVRSWYGKIKTNAFKMPDSKEVNTTEFILPLDQSSSLLDLELADYPAQYPKADGSPSKYWDDGERVINGKLQRPRPSQIVDTKLKDLDTSKEHFVQGFPENLICVDFDLTDANGEKSLELNLAAAAAWTPTYSELSKSGKALHNHYYYDGDVSQLAPLYAPGIEVLVFSGNKSLRRRVSKCNNVPIATLRVGQLPLKEKKRVLEAGIITNEGKLRKQIQDALDKKVHPGTKSNIDFINMLLEEAHRDGVQFDVSDMRQKITVFATGSTNQALNALKVVQTMRFKSDEVPEPPVEPVAKDPRIVLIDTEVYPNLFVICWKFKSPDGETPDPKDVITMINPKPHEVEGLFNLKLTGFNVRGYDNHILWAAAMGYNNAQLFDLSQKLIDDKSSSAAKFGEAFNLSYTDIYDFATKKQGLKKWQIELGIVHKEMDIPWEEPVPEDRIMDVAAYCANDVVSTEIVFNHLEGDWKARLILADLSGLSANHTTAQHTARIVFGNAKNPQSEFVYTHLAKEFPGYTFEGGKSYYRGELVGEGGLVRAKPGLWRNVRLLDVGSMHPTSIGVLNAFGSNFTPRYMALVQAQLDLKHIASALEKTQNAVDYSGIKGVLDGKLTPYIEEIEKLASTDRDAAAKYAKLIRYGLKIAMNIVYGLTSAKFKNPFKDERNVDNIVAKRGALFMIDLMNFIEKDLCLTVVHVKTDSVKVVDADDDDVKQIQEFARGYGYDLEEEATYSHFGLVNDAVYIAKKDECISNCWSATGAEYQVPYVFKKMFGYDDDISFYDLCVTKHVVKGKIFLDFGKHDAEVSAEGGEAMEDYGYVEYLEVLLKNAERLRKKAEKTNSEEDIAAFDEAILEMTRAQMTAEKNLFFVGKTGRFTPVLAGYGGGQLYRVLDGKHYAVGGTKGRLWVDSTIALDLPGDAIDYGYFEDQLLAAKAHLAEFTANLGDTRYEESLMRWAEVNKGPCPLDQRDYSFVDEWIGS